MDPTRPIAPSPRVSEPIQADRASFSTGTQELRRGHIEETDAQEDWLSLATADPAFWLTGVDR